MRQHIGDNDDRCYSVGFGGPRWQQGGALRELLGALRELKGTLRVTGGAL